MAGGLLLRPPTTVHPYDPRRRPIHMLWETFLLYLAAWFVVALTPGPAVLCSMAQATRHGFRWSLAGIAGVQVGNALFFVCIAAGVVAILGAAAPAFTGLRILRAAYLFYLGSRIVLASFRQRPSRAAQPARTPGSRHNLFLQGLLIQITNPKALLFVSALAPQFLDANRPMLLQLFILAVTTITVDGAVLSAYAFFADRGARRFVAPAIARWLERTFGAALVFFGLRLLLLRK